MALAGPTDWSSFLMAFIWLELHLLAFDASDHRTYLDIHFLTSLLQIKNQVCSLLPCHCVTCSLLEQMIGVEEDKICKPDRPFPSGRMTLACGQSLYLAIVSLAIALSVYHGLTNVSLIYMLAIWLYNENGLSAHPLLKSPLGAVGYMCYCWGSTYIIGEFLEKF
jgi:hypothetical protein